MYLSQVIKVLSRTKIFQYDVFKMAAMLNRFCRISESIRSRQVVSSAILRKRLDATYNTMFILLGDIIYYLNRNDILMLHYHRVTSVQKYIETHLI